MACEDLMLQRRVQFLLSHAHPASATRLATPQFHSVKVSDDVLLPVAAPLTSGRPAYIAQTQPDKPQPTLAYSQESGLGQIMRATLPAAFDAQSFVPVFTSHHAVLLKTMALEGRGLAWLPRSLVSVELGAGLLVAAGDERWQIPIEIRLTRQAAALPKAAEALWSVVSED